ncbi:hypothetical protein GXW84_31245 [Rhodococcus sp. IEGM 248]|uniref:hypothetical protein n=1 Tax=Rhodococcus opacus TaxID=37919 RepID=UPI0013C155A5|nr:hypothetical protein [Rhodococcus opacus]MDV7090037.1 hypothetical protein [Rhodococcus opacus]NDV08902.1 hypothetical protein [Rhodococcus sp. IEGM 248]
MNVQAMQVSAAPEGLGRYRDAVDALRAFDRPGHRTDPRTALLFDSLTDDLIEAAQTAGVGDTVPQRDIFAVIDTAISRPRPSL